MSFAEGCLRLEYLPLSRFRQQDRAWLSGALGGLCFSHPAAAPAISDLPLLAVDMPVLAGGEALCEIWHCHETLACGRQGAIRYRHGKSLLFGCLSLGEHASVDTRTPLQVATETAYQAIFELLESLNYNSVLRFWNYFLAINRASHGMERYRQFNIGRQDAFLAHGRSVIGNVPAACALGTQAGDLDIAFLATRADVTGLENPRQVSAYLYPSEYGPRSPTFSRAGRVNLGGRTMLFVSGTASIVGHRTLHEGDAAAQTRESMANIAALLDEANRDGSGGPFRLGQLAYKVYIRHPLDLPLVRDEMERFAGSPLKAVYLQADVCRVGLLVEIEASGGHALSFL